MMDENDRSHEDRRSLRHISRKEGSEDTAPIEVDSSAFFSETASGTAAAPRRPSVLLPRSRTHKQSRCTGTAARRIRPWTETGQHLPNGGIFC